MVSLDRISAGVEVIVSAVHGDDATCAALASRGITQGAHVTVVRTGDPTLLALEDARWAIRRSDLAAIDVIPLRTTIAT